MFDDHLDTAPAQDVGLWILPDGGDWSVVPNPAIDDAFLAGGIESPGESDLRHALSGLRPLDPPTGEEPADPPDPEGRGRPPEASSA